MIIYPINSNSEIPEEIARDAEVSDAIASHLAATNPHQITPALIGAASEPYAEDLAQDALNASWARTDDVIASHLAATNPHQISPTLIGAAAASHTHLGSQVTGNIPGNAANVTGIVAIKNGGTAASTAAQALTNLGAAAASHNHAASAINSGTVAIANGGTAASTAAAALTNLGAAPASHTHAANRFSFVFSAGWVNYGSTFEAIYQKADNLVILNGLIARTVSTSSNKNIATLPTKYRPFRNILCICWAYYNHTYQPVRIDVGANGVISLTWPDVSVPIGWISLGTISFFAV
jgi:hypothetical protein